VYVLILKKKLKLNASNFKLIASLRKAARERKEAMQLERDRNSLRWSKYHIDQELSPCDTSSKVYIKSGSKPSCTISEKALFVDVGVKNTFVGRDLQGNYMKTEDNGRLNARKLKISRLQSQRDQLVDQEAIVIQAKRALGDLERKLCQSLLSSHTVEYTEVILKEIEKAKKEEKDAIAAAKKVVNEARITHQRVNADSLRQKRLQELEVNFKNVKGRRTVGEWRPRTFDEEIKEEQERLNEDKEKLFREILKVAPFYEVIVLPRYLPKGKYSYLGYGKFYDRLEKVMRLRGGRVVYVSECNSTKLCHRCGCYSPPGLSRLFRCSNRRCGLVQGRDEKSATYQTLSILTFVGMEILQTGVQDNGSRKSAPQVAPE
jgi:hypothetical protein